MITDMYSKCSSHFLRPTLISLDLASGRETGPCPWKAITADLDAFIDQDVFMPKVPKLDSGGIQVFMPVRLQEPSKMQQDTIRRILHHWKERQNHGLVPFAFSHVLRAAVMVQALPLNVATRTLLALSPNPIAEDDPEDARAEEHSDTPQPLGSETAHIPLTSPTVSHAYPSPAPTVLADKECSSASPTASTPVPRSPSPPTHAPDAQENIVTPPTTDVVSVPAELQDTSVIDPRIPELTEAQLLVTGRQAFTTNELSGARITTSPEISLSTEMESQVGGLMNPINDPTILKHFAEYMRLHGSNQHLSTPIGELATPEPSPIKRKRGRPRKSLVVSEVNGISSPPKKRPRKSIASAPSQSPAATSAPSISARPTPRPVGKTSNTKRDLANLAPYDGLITRRMAAGRDVEVVGDAGPGKGKGKGKAI